MDNPDLALPFSVRHNEQPVRGGNTQAKKTGFAFRMIGVWNRDLERVREHRRSLREADVVLAEVLRGLVRVPFEFHAQSLRRHVGRR